MTAQTPAAGCVDPVWSAENIRRGPGRSRAQDIDRHVGARMRERRVMLGLTQQEMAELICVTYQQAHKYEKGINRVASGRLYHTAKALGCDVNYFFEGLDADKRIKPHPNPQDRQLLELARTYARLTSKQKLMVSNLVHALDDANG